MIEEVINIMMKKAIAVDYPYLKLPAVVFAKVSSVKKCGSYIIDDLTITDKNTGQTFPAHITADCYEYKLTVLKPFGSLDNSFPVLPGIKSKKQFLVDTIVAVAFAYGNVEPVIIGEVSQ